MEAEEPSPFEKKLAKFFHAKVDDVMMVCAVVLALALSILPSVLFLESGILRCYFPLIAAALLFAPCHILISYKNAAMKREIALNGEAPEQSVKDRQ